MKKIISSINPDIICTSLLTDCFFVVRAVASMDIPIISFFRGEVDFSNLSRFKRRILLDHLEFSDRIVAFSEQAKKAYPRESTAPITVLPPMIDINRFSPKELRFFGAKKELTIGFIYSSKDEEAVSLLTQVFSAIRKRLPYVKKLIIAFGESGQNAVRRIVAESGVSEWIDIVGPQKDIESIYHRMDFLISIREMQSMGISVLEAMSSRVIPIIGENSLMPDVISNGRNGFFINPRNIDETVRFFEEIFVDCVRNPSKFNRMAKLARETVHEKFSSGTITPLYEELFERLALNRETKK